MENSVGEHYSPCLLYIHVGKKECRGYTLSSLYSGGHVQYRGTLFTTGAYSLY